MKIPLILLSFLLAVSNTLAQPVYQPPVTRSLMNYPDGGAFRILITSYGFGIGGLYRHQISEDWAYQFESDISPGKDDREVEEYDYWTDQVYTRNKINSLLLIPFQNVLHYRLFRASIQDNFRPFLSAGAGPLMGYVFPTTDDFFSGLGDGKAIWGVTGSVGFGADFGSNFGLIQGLAFRYTFNYLPDGVTLLRVPTRYRLPDDPPDANDRVRLVDRVHKTFHAFHLSLSIGKMWPR
ncbi:MAG: hypothetical protein HUU10_11335 [Bacteroidetes bacterium]|nr:hypothetical protein [Bacteroidota bacterium]